MAKKLVVFENDQFMIVNKPAGLLTLPDRYDQKKENLRQLLQQKHDELFVVHRLDRETSGIMVFAKDAETHKNLSNQFQKRTVTKLYNAFVFGNPFEDNGLIENYLSEDPFQPGIMKVTARGKRSVTEWRVLERFKNHSILEANILTGRMHQIRVHFKNLGHPLLVDAAYGHQDAFYLSSLKGRKYRLAKHEVESPLVSRTTLHARTLKFNDPITGEPLVFEAPYPKDLAALHKQLTKWGK